MEQCAVVYVDFSKAFDVLSHIKLFIRLYCYGIRGKLLCWLKNFFYDDHLRLIGKRLCAVFAHYISTNYSKKQGRQAGMQ